MAIENGPPDKSEKIHPLLEHGAMEYDLVEETN